MGTLPQSNGESRGAADVARPASRLANPRETRAVLDEFGLATKHRLGQNFLINDDVIARILGLAEIASDDVVLEVGPGIGTLTVALLPRAAAVVAVEADRSLEPVLAQTCAADSERFALLLDDALKVGPQDLEAALAALGRPGVAPAPTMFVSNLPYQVAATVVMRAFEELPTLRRAVVMVQAEVADRIAASPGSKAYGAYTAKLALFAQVTGRFEVGPGNFMPPPHVQSAVVRIDRDPLRRADGNPLDEDAIAATCRVIDAAFAQRRKTIRNSMAAKGFDKAALDRAFAETGIGPGCRAETLAPADFARLSDALCEQGALEG